MKAIDYIPDNLGSWVDEDEWEVAIERLRSAGESTPAEPVPSASATGPDTQVKGLWLTCSSFPKDAKVDGFLDSDDVDGMEIVNYTRSIDGVLFFTIMRQLIEESELREPGDVEGFIEFLVEQTEGDMDEIDVNTEADEFSELYSYPCATAEYETGQNEDTHKNAALFIFTDKFCFIVEASVAADYFYDYSDRLMGWFTGLEFVEDGNGG